MSETRIHPSATIDPSAHIGEGSLVWVNVQVRENAEIGKRCVLSIESKVFVGPNASFTNDKVPRAFSTNWEITKTMVKQGASLGANCTVICGIVIGEYAMVAAGSVVTKDVPPYTLVAGNPARVVGEIDKAGNKIS